MLRAQGVPAFVVMISPVSSRTRTAQKIELAEAWPCSRGSNAAEVKVHGKHCVAGLSIRSTLQGSPARPRALTWHGRMEHRFCAFLGERFQR